MTEASLFYHFPQRTFTNISLGNNDLEKIIHLSRGIKGSVKDIKENNPSIKIIVATAIRPVAYRVYLSGEKEQITKAITTIMNSAGTPEFVSGNYGVINQTLEKYGEKTERKFFGCFDGKRVVPK